MQLKLEIFRDSSLIVFAIPVTLVAVFTKLIGCGIGAWGMGMVPRGEVGIVVAQIGLAMAVINDSLYGIVLLMSIATTLIAPPFLRVLYAPENAKAQGESPVSSNEESLNNKRAENAAN